MNKDDLKKLVAKKIGVSASEQDLAYQILIDGMAKNLNDVKNAIKVKGLGVFQLEKNKTRLIYSPFTEKFSDQSESFYLKLDIPNPPSDSEDFDEDIFSLSIGKSILSVGDEVPFRESSETSLVVIRKQIEERVKDILSESTYYKNFDLLESFMETELTKEEEKNEVTIEEPEESTEPEVEEEKHPGSKLEDENGIIDEADQNEDEPAGEDNADDIKDDDFELMDETTLDHFIDSFDSYSYPEERDKKTEEGNEAGKDSDEYLDEDYEAFKNLTLNESGEATAEHKSLFDDLKHDEDTQDKLEEEKDLEQSEQAETKAEKESGEDHFDIEELEETEVEKESLEWNWSDELSNELEGDRKHELKEEDFEPKSNDEEVVEVPENDDNPFDTLEKTLSEDVEFKKLTSEDDSSTKMTEETGNLVDEKAATGSTAYSKNQTFEEEFAMALNSEEKPKPESTKDKEEQPVKPGKETTESKISSYREKSSTGSLIVIGSFVVIVAALLYFLFSSGGGSLEEPSDIPTREEILNESTDETTPVETVEDQTTTSQGEVKAEDLTYDDLYRELPNEERVSNLIFRNGESYNVQVSSWQNPIKAENEAKRLIQAGYDAFIVKAYLPSKGGTWHRVRIGGFNSVDEARKFSNEYQN